MRKLLLITLLSFFVVSITWPAFAQTNVNQTYGVTFGIGGDDLASSIEATIKVVLYIGMVIGLLMLIIGLIMWIIWKNKYNKFEKDHNLVWPKTERDRLDKTVKIHDMVIFFGVLVTIFGFLSQWTGAFRLGLFMIIYGLVVRIIWNKKLKKYDKEQPEAMGEKQRRLEKLDQKDTQALGSFKAKKILYGIIAGVGLALLIICSLLYAIVSFTVCCSTNVTT